MNKITVSVTVTEDGQLKLSSDAFAGDPLTRKQSLELAMSVLFRQGADGAAAARSVLAALDAQTKAGG